MKKKYITPVTGVRKMDTESLLVTLSGGETGGDGDVAQSKGNPEEWGSIWDEE